VRPEKIRILREGESDARALPGVVRDVGYLGSVTRYTVELDRGETVIVLRQNLDTSAADVLAQRGRRVRLAWREQDEAVLNTNDEEERKP
jgi:putative spermidine/putrescine transport system ATP-binding protein